MSLWTTMADPAALQGLQVPKAVRFSKKDLAAAQAILEKRLKPYRRSRQRNHGLHYR